MDETKRALKHADLLYDYIKFHITLYIATPPVLAIMATALGVQADPDFQKGMAGLLVIYFVAGAHASWMIAGHINTKWTANSTWTSFGEKADSFVRRCIHHYLYWIGLGLGLCGMGYAWITV